MPNHTDNDLCQAKNVTDNNLCWAKDVTTTCVERKMPNPTDKLCRAKIIRIATCGSKRCRNTGITTSVKRKMFSSCMRIHETKDAMSAEYQLTIRCANLSLTEPSTLIIELKIRPLSLITYSKVNKYHLVEVLEFRKRPIVWEIAAAFLYNSCW